MLVRLRTTGPTTSNFIAYSRHGTEQGSLLANEIGVTDQVVPLDFGARPAAGTTAFQVRSDTSWEITLIPLSATGTFGKGRTIGESRSTVWHYVGAAGTARLTNNATTGNFIVVAYNADTGYSDLLVNEIGPFDGHVPIKARQYLEIKSDGPWAIIVN